VTQVQSCAFVRILRQACWPRARPPQADQRRRTLRQSWRRSHYPQGHRLRHPESSPRAQLSASTPKIVPPGASPRARATPVGPPLFVDAHQLAIQWLSFLWLQPHMRVPHLLGTHSITPGSAGSWLPTIWAAPAWSDCAECEQIEQVKNSGLPLIVTSTPFFLIDYFGDFRDIINAAY